MKRAITIFSVIATFFCLAAEDAAWLTETFPKQLITASGKKVDTETALKGKTVAVYFSASWCGPCRMVAPILKDLAKEYGDSIVIYKVDTDKEKELSMAMGIQSLPTIVFIPTNGQPQVIVGAADKATFRRAIDEVLLNKK